MSAISLYARSSPDFAQKLAHSLALLASSAVEYSPLTQASSLGAEDMVITHLMYEADLAAGMFVLDTEKLHLETMALIDRIEARYQRRVNVYRPDPEAAAAFVQANGDEAMYQSLALRKACCDIRKMEPLARALDGKKGWITGLRREQSDARAEVPYVEHQEGRAKINPLADWTLGDVWHYISVNAIPYNPLHDQFYPSIGCEPCTHAVALGEDFRSGRWWWENESAKECGLHGATAGRSSVISASNILPIRQASAA